MSLKILVADDDRVLSQMLCSVLRQVGHKPLPAFDAVQALMLAKRDPLPDLVLLDIGMPGGSGLQTLAGIKNSSKTYDLPVIVISGSVDKDMPDKAMKAGAARYVEKPIDPSMLLQIIREVMEEQGRPV
jgi:CheY-like chemotaxis protein